MQKSSYLTQDITTKYQIKKKIHILKISYSVLDVVEINIISKLQMY